jgi:hypothetical protein
VPIGYPTAIGAIQFSLQQAGMSARDLIPFIGILSEISLPLGFCFLRAEFHGVSNRLESLQTTEGEAIMRVAVLDQAISPSQRAALNGTRD